MRSFSILLLLTALSFFTFSCKKTGTEDDIRTTDILVAEKLPGLHFTDSERDSMRADLVNNRDHYRSLRSYDIPNDVPPALIFNPLPQGLVIPERQIAVSWKVPGNVRLPDDKNVLAFYSLPELAALLRSQKISSVELTRFFIDRLKKFGDTLQCVISLTEEYALNQARKMDEEIESGHCRGILHGIPYGIKDLFAFPGYPTTWGAGPYKDQYLDEKATVIIAPSFEGDQLLLTNLTGHPCVVLPNGFTGDGNPLSISLLGNLFDEATILAVAVKFQEATDFEDRHPSLFE